jgi:hypothetical protein
VGGARPLHHRGQVRCFDARRDGDGGEGGAQLRYHKARILVLTVDGILTQEDTLEIAVPAVVEALHLET